MIIWESLSTEEQNELMKNVDQSILKDTSDTEQMNEYMKELGYNSAQLQEEYLRGKHQQMFFAKGKRESIITCGYTMADATKKAILLHHEIDIYPGVQDDTYSEEQLDAATGWWAEELSYDNPEDDPFGLYYVPTSLELERFRVALKETIVRHMDMFKLVTHVGVDYNPDTILKEAVSIASFDIPKGKSIDYPRKTMMVLERDSIVVSAGYGVPFETIFKKA